MSRLKQQYAGLEKLRPFIDRATRVQFRKDRFFSKCVRASLAKAYQFNVLIYGRRWNSDAFFIVSTLRGITEDLIILRFLAGLPPEDREKLVFSLTMHETHSRLSAQAAFFAKSRPYQQVLGPSLPPTAILRLENEIRSVWQRHGWPGLTRGVMPQTRQIAEKQGLALLTDLYDFLYRLTSGLVHFNPQVLIRSGWGRTKREVHFSPNNFHRYYLLFARTYGAYLLCLYFEFFSRFLRPGAGYRHAINRIREELILQSRWPEMVTFEEMNLTPPKQEFLAFVLRFIDAQRKKKLVA